MQSARRIDRRSVSLLISTRISKLRKFLEPALLYCSFFLILFWVNRLVFIPGVSLYVHAAPLIFHKVTDFEYTLIHHLISFEFHLLGHIYHE